MTFKTLKFLLFYFICALIFAKADVNPEWEKPDAWSRHRNRLAKEKKLNGNENVENNSIDRFEEVQDSCHKERDMKEISKMYYTRLANSLFNEKKFKVISSYYGSMKVY